MRWQGKFGRKPTGGKLIPARGKRKHEVGREQSDTTIAAVRVKKIETRGGNQKMRMMRGDMATVSDPVTGQSKVVKIERVSENGGDDWQCITHTLPPVYCVRFDARA